MTSKVNDNFNTSNFLYNIYKNINFLALKNDVQFAIFTKL